MPSSLFNFSASAFPCLECSASATNSSRIQGKLRFYAYVFILSVNTKYFADDCHDELREDGALTLPLSHLALIARQLWVYCENQATTLASWESKSKSNFYP